MRNKSSCVLLMLGLIVQVSASQAQEARTLDFLQPKAKGNIIQIVREPANSTISEGHLPTTFKEYLLINGQKTALPSGESYEDATGEFILTSKTKEVAGITQKSLQTYTLQDGTLKPKAKISIDELQSYRLLGSKGNILISDEFEGLGYEVNVYSPELQKLASYSPFGKAGFSSTLSYINESRSVYIFFPAEKQPGSKMVLMDTNTGRVVSETSLKGNITNVVLAGDKILVQEKITGTNQLIGYDDQGKEAWRLQQTADALLPIKTGGRQQAFVMDGEAYRFIDVLTGKPGETTPLSSLRAGIMGNDYSLDVAPANNDSEVLLLVSRKNTDISFQHEVFRITAFGQAEKIKTLSNTEAVVRFNRLSHAVLLTNLSNQILYRYEK
jgi:hypothetical protein